MKRERFRPESASEPHLEYTVRRVNAQGLLVIGSIGRAVIFNQLRGDPMLELRHRGEMPLVSSLGRYKPTPRDVDVIGGEPEGERGSYGPHKADALGFSEMIQRDSNGNWIFVGKDGRITRLDPSIFEPVEGISVLGIPCRTVRPATHLLLLTGSSVTTRIARELLLSVLPEEERALLETPPYQQLRDLLSAYFANVPH